MKLDNAIKMISQKTKKDTGLLKKEFEGILNEVKTAMPDETEETLMEIATNKMFRSYRKKMNSSGQEYTGFFISIGGRFDMIKKRRAALEEAIEEVGEEKALELKMIDDKGNLLFYETPEKLTTMKDWQKKNIGTEMPLMDFKRSVLGAVIVDGKPIRFEMRLRGNNSKVIPKLFAKTTFRGFKLDNASTETDYTLNDSGTFAPEYTDDLTETEVIGLLKELYEDRMIESTDVDAFTAAHGSEFSPMAVMKVDVIELSTNTTKNGSKIMSVADDGIPLDEIMICWVPEFFEFNFMENATIYLIGSPKKDDKGKISIGVSGMYIPTIYREAVPETKDIDTDKW